jgi:hypothetical protein
LLSERKKKPPFRLPFKHTHRFLSYVIYIKRHINMQGVCKSVNRSNDTQS